MGLIGAEDERIIETAEILLLLRVFSTGGRMNQRTCINMTFTIGAKSLLSNDRFFSKGSDFCTCSIGFARAILEYSGRSSLAFKGRSIWRSQ